MADCTMKWTLKYGRKEKDIVAALYKGIELLMEQENKN